MSQNLKAQLLRSQQKFQNHAAEKLEQMKVKFDKSVEIIVKNYQIES